MKRTFLLFLILTTLLCAQEFRATLTGRVTDSSDAAMPGVTVTVRNNATNEISSAATGAQGAYTIPLLRPGTYTIRVEVAGFKKFSREGLILNMGQAATVDVKLEVGDVSETVTVSGEAPLLDMVNADRGTVLDNRRLREIPVMGRTSVMYAKLVPGVSFNGVAYATYPAGQGSIQNWAINGGRNASNEFLLDGAPNNIRAGDNIIGYVPPVDSLGEFKIQTNSYDAQYGHTGGGVINMSLKSGTNLFHGTTYEFAQRTGWNGNLFQNNSKKAPRDKSLFDQYGIEADGPLYIPGLYDGRNRTFFMGAFEGYRLQLPNAITTSVPTAEMLNGDFSKLADSLGRPITIYDPMTGRDVNGTWVRDTFSGNTIPANRINPIAQKILGYMSKPNTVSAGQAYATNNYFISGGDNAGRNTVYSFTTKVDQNIGNKHRVFGRFGWNEFTYLDSSNGIRGLPGVNGDWGQKKINHAAVLDWVGTLTPTFIANIRASFNRFQWDVKMDPNSNFDLTSLGFPASLDAQLPIHNWFPVVSISGYQAMGRNYYINHTNNYALQPNFTKVQGSHVIKAGMDMRWIQYAIQDPGGALQLASSTGWTQKEYNVGDALSGNSVASFLLGTPSSGSGNYVAFPMFFYRYYAPWVQDDWKVTRRLTVNLGLRWDFNISPNERHNRLNRGFDATAVNPVNSQVDRTKFPTLQQLNGGLLFAGVNGASRTAADVYKRAVGPRFGVAYTISSKLVVRGGWGRVFINPTNDYQQTIGFSQSTSMVTTLDGGRTPIANVLNNPLPSGIQMPTGSSLGLSTYLGRGFNFVNSKFKLPYMNQFSFGFQYELPFSSKIEVSYVGSRGKNLQSSRSYNLYSLDFRKTCNPMEGGNPTYCNQLVANPFAGIQSFYGTTYYSAASVSRATLALGYPHFGSLAEVARNDAASWYNSMQITWETRAKNGFNILAAYTLAKQIEQNGFNDVYAGVLQRGLVNFDRPHTLTVSTVYELPFGKGKHWAAGAGRFTSRLVSGWKMSMILNVRSGMPWALPSNVIYVKEAKIDNIDWSAPIIRGVKPCVARWNDNGTITMQAFSTQYGCTDYNFLITPSYAPRVTPNYDGRLRIHTAPIMDFSLNKTTQITERISTRFSAEAFNLTNTFDFYNYQFSNNANSSLFGTITKDAVGRDGTNMPRTIQIGIKVIW